MTQPRQQHSESPHNAQPPTPHSTQQRKAAMQEPAGGIISPEELATRWLKQPYPPTPQQSAVIKIGRASCREGARVTATEFTRNREVQGADCVMRLEIDW